MTKKQKPLDMDKVWNSLTELILVIPVANGPHKPIHEAFEEPRNDRELEKDCEA